MDSFDDVDENGRLTVRGLETTFMHGMTQATWTTVALILFATMYDTRLHWRISTMWQMLRSDITSRAVHEEEDVEMQRG